MKRLWKYPVLGVILRVSFMAGGGHATWMVIPPIILILLCAYFDIRYYVRGRKAGIADKGASSMGESGDN